MIFEQLPPGKTVQERKIISYKTAVKSSKFIHLLGGTHGDEVEGIYVLDALFQWLKVRHELKDLPVVVTPILNVDGYEQGTRVNAHCIDLNRNYPASDWSAEFTKDKYNPGPAPLSEPENKYLIGLFNKYPPSFVLSFHTWKPILNYNGNCKDVADFLGLYNNYPVSETIGYDTPGSLGTFVPEKYEAGVLTFECPPLSDTKSLKDIWQENQEGLKAFFSSPLVEFKISETS